MTQYVPLSDAERQKQRNKRILDAGLVQRKVVGHPDDFDAIRAFAQRLHQEREAAEKSGKMAEEEK